LARARLLAALLTAFFLMAGPASAATTLDIRGPWHCCSQASGGAAATEFTIATLDFATGQWTGSGYGGPYTWPMSGVINGNQMTETVPYYNELRSYSASFTATVSADAKTITGNWRDSNGSSGTFTANRVAAPPPPQAGKTVNAKVLSGKVLVKLPGAKVFDDLGKVALSLPVGTIVDTTKGRIQLTAAQSPTSGKIATASFFKGVFKIGQKLSARPVTDLKLVGGSFAACAKRSRLGATAAQKTKVRELWGTGKGLFRTSGKFSAATIRGTNWAVTDYCDGTLTKVTSGAVTVRDFRLRRNVVVKAPRSYFAKAG
jgi:hypothetical protein